MKKIKILALASLLTLGLVAYTLDSYKTAKVKADTNVILLEVEEAETAQNEAQQDVFYKVPLIKEHQKYLKKLCKKYGVPEKVVLALIQKESNFQADIISKTNDYGLMQINKINHNWLAEKLNITNFLDVKQNLKAGIFLLADCITNTKTLEQALMCYGLGYGGANQLFNQGVCSTTYTRDLLNIANNIEVI